MPGLYWLKHWLWEGGWSSREEIMKFLLDEEAVSMVEVEVDTTDKIQKEVK
jgi:hypothetical protein